MACFQARPICVRQAVADGELSLGCPELNDPWIGLCLAAPIILTNT
jgi:hypothetical protein